MAQVTPIFKTGNMNDQNNYRPISVLPGMSKILEKYINFKLVKYLESQNLLYKHQYGFRKSRDSEVSVMDIITEIQENIDCNKKCALASLDLWKAFDTVDHKILL